MCTFIVMLRSTPPVPRGRGGGLKCFCCKTVPLHTEPTWLCGPNGSGFTSNSFLEYWLLLRETKANKQNKSPSLCPEESANFCRPRLGIQDISVGYFFHLMKDHEVLSVLVKNLFKPGLSILAFLSNNTVCEGSQVHSFHNTAAGSRVLSVYSEAPGWSL